MTEPVHVAPLIPWYANGTLEAAERQAVESHLPSCERCRELLETSRRQQELSREHGLEAHLDHVHPTLLTQYAEDPGRLEAETVSWIEERLAGCATCREAYALLKQVERGLARAASPARVVETETARPSLWEMLSSTILRPAPALAYLAALALISVLWWREPPTTTDLATSPVRVVLPDERVTRAAPGEQRPGTPIEIAGVPGPLLLELETRLEPEDLQDPGTSFSVELLRDDETLWSQPRAEGDFLQRDGKLVLAILLYPASLDRGAVHEIVVRVVKPSDPLDGQALYRRSIVVR